MFNSCFERLLSSPKVTFRLEDSVSSTVGETENNRNKQHPTHCRHSQVKDSMAVKNPDKKQKEIVKNSTNLRNSCKNVFCLFFYPEEISSVKLSEFANTAAGRFLSQSSQPDISLRTREYYRLQRNTRVLHREWG